MPALTSRNGSLTYAPGLPTVLINDQLCVTSAICMAAATLQNNAFQVPWAL